MPQLNLVRRLVAFPLALLVLVLQGCGGGSINEPTTTNASGVDCSSGIYTYARLNNGVTGDELYKINGVGECTRVVKDFSKIAGSSIYDDRYLWGLGNGTVIYRADDGIHGHELWSSNGGPASLIRDMAVDGDLRIKSSAIARGEQGQQGYALVDNSLLYFVVDDRQTNLEHLWVSDGSDAGTVKLHTADDIRNVIAYDGRVYFATKTSDVSTIWSTGGTPVDTSEFLSDSMTMPTVANGQLYFMRDTSLYRTNGTSDGTFLVGTITSTFRPRMVAVNNMLVISANTVNGKELFASDGTAAPVSIGIVGTATDRSVYFFKGNVVGNRIFISVINSTGDASSIWVTGGTAESTVSLSGINLEIGRGAGLYTEANNRVYFRNRDGVNGFELWSWDGAILNMIDLDPDSFSYPDDLIAFNGNLYFTAFDSTSGRQLWMHDGTDAIKVSDNLTSFNHASIGPLVVYKNEIYFMGEDDKGRELWKSNGEVGNVQRITDLNPLGPSLYQYQDIMIYDNLLYFIASDGVHGSEVWRSDGTVGNTEMVADVSQVNVGSGRPSLFSHAGVDYFIVNDRVSTGLWRIDQSDATLIKRIPGLGRVGNMTSLGGYVYFDIEGSDEQDGIWRTDGSELNTTRILDFNTMNPVGRSNVTGMVNYLGDIYFLANRAGFGFGLWKLNIGVGTAEEVHVIHSDVVTSNSGFGLQVHLNKMFFSADDGVNGMEAWVSDGTTTELLFDANLAGGSGPGILFELKSKIYFTAWNGSARELWVSDGLVANTTLVVTDFDPRGAEIIDDTAYFFGKDKLSGESGLYAFSGTTFSLMVNLISTPSGYNITQYQNKIYFLSEDLDNPATHSALWVTDGSVIGTRVVKSVPFDLGGSESDGGEAEDLVTAGGLMYFVNYDNVNGEELWVSDGTGTGTSLLADLNPGIADGAASNPLAMH
ncbi:MAG: hypothetical protein L3J98_15580 [Gammaproteobacteria bacterium]|nr:hypothetical protein [Gammaproteobacteria bacterium]MCF6261558.1 hypothetical protein [Gammaproteobacteria bacterium]